MTPVTLSARLAAILRVLAFLAALTWPQNGLAQVKFQPKNDQERAQLQNNLAGFRDQPAALLEQFAKEPHTGPEEEALVGIEVIDVARDLTTTQIRRSNGLVIRCDGFLLVPTAVTSYVMPGQTQEADHQIVKVILHPGTDQAKQVYAYRRRYDGHKPDYIALKLFNTHTRRCVPCCLIPSNRAIR